MKTIKEISKSTAIIEPIMTPARTVEFERPDVPPGAAVVLEKLVIELVNVADESRPLEAAAVGAVLATIATPRANPSYG
jgi:hypothetical protein